jgi:putative tricarboxylic transport membrane protein
MRESATDIAAGVFLFVMALAIFVYSYHIKVLIPIDIGSGFFPRLVAVMLALTSLPIIVSGLRRYLREKGAPFKAPHVNIFGVMASIVCMGLYISLLNVLGFFIASILYLAAQFSVLALNDRKNMIRIGILSLVIPVFVYVAFVYGFDMILPECSLLY